MELQSDWRMIEARVAPLGCERKIIHILERLYFHHNVNKIGVVITYSIHNWNHLESLPPVRYYQHE